MTTQLSRDLDLDTLRTRGFSGFLEVGVLRAERCRSVPDQPGVYLVAVPSEFVVRFLSTNVGGWFKGRNPTVPLSMLAARRLVAGEVAYVGMAGTSLRSRVRALVDYGGGKPVGHQGGRLLWQVDRSDALLVAWKDVSAPRAEEVRLLGEYERAHGQLPFANLSH